HRRGNLRDPASGDRPAPHRPHAGAGSVKQGLAPAVASGDPLALARAISLVEEGYPKGEEILADLFPRTGRARVIGITGPPGVGQDEVDVVRVADTVLVVLSPGQGDDIQAIKAGILEIADIFVINKSDHPGADRLAADLEAMLSLGEPRSWRPPIVRTVATDGAGIDAL